MTSFYMQGYHQLPRVKKSEQEHRQSPAYKAYQRKYQPAYRREYNQRPEVILRRRKYQLKRLRNPKIRAKKRAYDRMRYRRRNP